MVELSDVSYRPDRRTIVDRVDTRFEPGTVTVLVGPAGAGKTTLLRLLSGELRPTSGSVTFRSRTGGDEQGELVLLDEPSLDPSEYRDLPSLFHRLAMSGATVVAALQNLRDAMLFADRALVMHRGQIVADGLPQIVLEPRLLGMVFGMPCAIERGSERTRRPRFTVHERAKPR